MVPSMNTSGHRYNYQSTRWKPPTEEATRDNYINAFIHGVRIRDLLNKLRITRKEAERYQELLPLILDTRTHLERTIQYQAS